MSKMVAVMLVSVVLGACGGVVVDGPPGEPPFGDGGGDVAAGCVNFDAPTWCFGKPRVGVECAPPHQYPAACEAVPNGPGGEVRYCCNALPDGGPQF